ncbi:hypothetical protein [Sphingobium phenoxybenzoativorans]|uniref:hypothetical protein n=1 Tax=Sphingobium phenoxybenzoativorans TaxID=1592790 RepID=UPI001112E4C8|nr:hypothetical protein [Sphingobium phenoxybenzoativorans]
MILKKAFDHIPSDPSCFLDLEQEFIACAFQVSEMLTAASGTTKVLASICFSGFRALRMSMSRVIGLDGASGFCHWGRPANIG